MLGQVLGHLRNWFLAPGGIRTGEYTITENGIDLPFLIDGQYFRIVGSVLNDGVYQYTKGNALGLRSETFTGAVWALKVPPEVLDLTDRIKAWQDKYKDIAASPYVSESFGGYTYTKAGGNAAGDKGTSWQDAFRAELNRWRKI